MQRGGESGAAGRCRQRQARLAGVQTPDAGSGQRVAVYEARNERLQHSLGFGRCTEITAQVVNFVDEVHVRSLCQHSFTSASLATWRALAQPLWDLLKREEVQY